MIKNVSGLGLTGANVGGWIIKAFEGVVKTVAYLADYLNLLKAGWHTLQGIAAGALLATLQPLNLLIQAVDYIVNKLTGSSSTWAAFSQGLIDGLEEQAGNAFKAAGEDIVAFADGRNTAAVRKFFSEIEQGAAKAKAAQQGVGDAATATALKIEAATTSMAGKVKETLDKLRQEVAQFGMTDGDKTAAELKGMGATDAQIGEAKGLQDQLDALEKQKKASEEAADAAKRLYEETRTPAEKYAAQLEQINELLIKGAIDRETADRAAAKARTDTLGKEDKKTEAPGALVAGSSQAANFIAQAQNRQRGNDAQDKIESNTKTGVVVARQMLAELKQQTATATTNTGGVTINVVSV